MRVLYAVPHPIPLSENYIRNEIEWMVKAGVEIGVWAHQPRLAKGYPEEDARILGIGGDINKVVDTFKPDLVHAHPLFMGEIIANQLKGRVPLTIRGHVGFTGLESGNPQLIKSFAERKDVARVWAFPHIAADINSPKIAPLPVCFSTATFGPYATNLRGPVNVVRVATSLPGKGLEEFVEIARRCPELPFQCALAVPMPDYTARLIASASDVPNLKFHIDLGRSQIAQLLCASWIYLRGHDPKSHRYGMPISIAEALASGLPIIARAAPEASRYIGPAGQYYDSPQDAVRLLREMALWSVRLWDEAEARSVEQSQLYRDDVVLPDVLRFWTSLP